MRTIGMVSHLLDAQAADEHGDPDYIPLENEEGEEESEEEHVESSGEESGEPSEIPDDNKDLDYVPLDDDESFDEEASDELTETRRCQWSCNGARTIDEVIGTLQATIEELRKYQNDGWVLDEEAADDHAILLSPE